MNYSLVQALGLGVAGVFFGGVFQFYRAREGVLFLGGFVGRKPGGWFGGTGLFLFVFRLVFGMDAEGNNDAGDNRICRAEKPSDKRNQKNESANAREHGDGEEALSHEPKALRSAESGPVKIGVDESDSCQEHFARDDQGQSNQSPDQRD